MPSAARRIGVDQFVAFAKKHVGNFVSRPEIAASVVGQVDYHVFHTVLAKRFHGFGNLF